MGKEWWNPSPKIEGQRYSLYGDDYVDDNAPVYVRPELIPCTTREALTGALDALKDSHYSVYEEAAAMLRYALKNLPG